jgi:hypothetical protein
MRKLVIALATVMATAFVMSERSEAVVLAPGGLAPALEATQSLETVGCHREQYCTPAGACEWRRVCHRGCPDGISCYPLYGHYGPWGGRAYWSEYSPAYSYYRH